MTIDLRSDFIAGPTSEMVAAMIQAAERPAGFGPREDATVAHLERLAADTLGLSDALFCPTCTMANQIAIHLRCRPGEAFITEAESHIVTSESAAAAALSGAMPKLVPATGGTLDVAALDDALHGADAQRPRVGLVVIENTHVRSGGKVIELEHMLTIAKVARMAGVPVHLDGARLFNAACALGVEARQLAACAESVAFNLNKGLGAPLGAILAGPADFISEAVRVRQMFGGGWRPANIPAAAGIVALECMIGRLADDHARARTLAEGLAALSGIDVDPNLVDSNIVLARPTEAAPGMVAEALIGEGVLVLPFGPFLRLVTHHEFTDADANETLTAFGAVLERVGR